MRKAQVRPAVRLGIGDLRPLSLSASHKRRLQR